MPVIVITVTNASYGPMALVVPGAIMIVEEIGLDDGLAALTQLGLIRPV